MRYAKYKPTGIAWLPEVPEGWEVVRLKNVLRERVEKSATGLEEPLSMSQKRGIVPTREMDVVPNAASSYVGAKKVYVNDIVFNKLKAHLGVFAISAYDGLVSPDYAVYTSSGLISRKYLEYLFHTPLYITEFRRKSTGIAIGLTRLYTKDLYSIYGVCPPTGVQRAIVAFLDEKCGKVDRWVAAKEREVALLKELKQAMIAEAVTGATKVARTDTARKMKPSSIPWLPEVPEGWEVKRARYLFKRVQRPVREGDEIVTCFRDGQVTLRKNRRTSGFTEATDYSHYQGIRKGDLVIHQMDAFAGACGVSDADGMGTPVLSICRAVDAQYCAEYFAYVVRLMGWNKFIQSLARGIRERSTDFRYETFAKQVLPVPPLAEQRAIVAYIEARAAKIDAAVAGLEREIAAMKEYKQRLIADVVTGQRKVA